MKVTWDFSEFEKFADGLADKHPFDTAMMTATQNIARVLHGHLLKNTPVDTGNLRKMWSAGDNLLFTVERVSEGFEVTLVNKAKSGKDARSDDESTGFMYGIAVNDGHKTTSGGWVMGKFFVEASLLQTAKSTKIDAIIMEQLQKWWDSV